MIPHFSLLSKLNEEKTIRATLCIVKDEEDAFLKGVLYATDTTESKLKEIYQSAQIDSINEVYAIAEYTAQGTLIAANEDFLSLMGYTLYDIQGAHHSIFIDEEERKSEYYQEFWPTLQEGEVQRGMFKRLGRNEAEVWVLTSYLPILDENDVVFRVIEYAQDVTTQQLENAEIASKFTAINKTSLIANSW